MSGRSAMILAGGSGGHVFPALAAAEAMADWRIVWLGVSGGLEERIVPACGYRFYSVAFSPPRGMASIPRLLRAVWQAWKVLRIERPAVLLGFGGFASAPGALAGIVRRLPLVIHESNAVAGRANRLLCRFAGRVAAAHPQVLPGAEAVATPARAAFYQTAPPQERYAKREGSLFILILGGSGGAKALNQIVPRALAGSGAKALHQCGRGKREECQAAYARAGVQAEVVEFIGDVATAMANADLLICRAGASTLAEIAAVGVAALLIPYPFAADDHQAANAAAFAADSAARWMRQEELSADKLAALLQTLRRPALLEMAKRAREKADPNAARAIARICQDAYQKKRPANSPDSGGRRDAGD